MQQLGFIVSSDFAEVEEKVFAMMTSFKDRIDVVSVMPVSNEADVNLVHKELGKVISDMQMFSNTLTEGLQRGINPGYPGIHFGTSLVEGSKAATA